MRISQLQLKEIINIRDGGRLGAVNDLEVDMQSGKITSLVLFGKNRLLRLVGKGSDLVIPWEAITMIGEETVLVDMGIG